MKKINLKTLISCFLIVFILLGGIGSLFTTPNTNTDWYNSIKPSITPPSFVFPIVWNFLFILISFSLYFAWTSAKNKIQKRNIIIFFGINFILNILWSVLFFVLKLPKIAFTEIILLWVSILVLIAVTEKINLKSSWLLWPYMIWVAFASILNWIIGFG